MSASASSAQASCICGELPLSARLPSRHDRPFAAFPAMQNGGPVSGAAVRPARNGSAPKDLPRPAYQSLIRPLGLIRSSPLARFHAPPGTRLRAFRRSDGAIQVRDQISATSDGPSRFLAQRGKSPVRQNCCLHKMDARLGISRDALYREWACRRSAILGGPASTGNANHDAASYSRVAQIGRPLTVLSGKRVVSTGPS